jgi:hypothetical protein
MYFILFADFIDNGTLFSYLEKRLLIIINNLNFEYYE